MLDYNIFSHSKSGFFRYMPHFNEFITEPVTTGLDRFFAVFCGPVPWSLISGTGPDHEALYLSEITKYKLKSILLPMKNEI